MREVVAKGVARKVAVTKESSSNHAGSPVSARRRSRKLVPRRARKFLKNLFIAVSCFSICVTPGVLYFDAIHRGVLGLGVLIKGSVNSFLVDQGFVASRIIISGCSFSDKSEIYALVPRSNNLLFLSVTDLGTRLKQRMPWVRDFVIRKELPDVLEFRLHEYKPLAILSTGDSAGDSFFIAEDGSVIQKVSSLSDFVLRHENVGEKITELIRVRSDNVFLSRTFTDDIKRFLSSGLRHSISKLVLVSNRRWNVILVNGMVVLLPEIGWFKAWQYFERLVSQSDITDSGFKSVDLRVPFRIFID